MGNLKQEGDAINVLCPNNKDMVKGELYRIDKWNGIAMSDVLHTDPELGLALEVSNRIWYIKLPTGLAAARGDILWWSATDGYKDGTTDLVVAGTSSAVGPACKVEEAVDANHIAAVRVLNIA